MAVSVGRLRWRLGERATKCSLSNSFGRRVDLSDVVAGRKINVSRAQQQRLHRCLSPAVGHVRVSVGSRREYGEQGDSHEVAERGLRPLHLRSTVEPRGIDEKDDPRDYDLAEPADDEEQRGQDDRPEAKLGQTERMPEVEHVPGDPASASSAAFRPSSSSAAGRRDR